ncbi:DivIVA domain-containing protein [Clostridium manihotivorum]|uniref:Cell division protein DivIVA n=1 Tax=Clostridium manihotivorum TaxID=2320868 RepID=A0A3R5V7T2_9CLOT|nr:DivIVA domain-containing protein [Clostridium manihotivorum]QAA32041.1 cell division protein DivIVA [Clostridium manihotivorum]
MKLTPMEITNKEFKRGIRGYNSEEVDEFLEQVVEEYENLYKENGLLKEKLAAVGEKVEHYAKIENTIQNTLLLAQNTAEQAKLNAQKEAELIVSNANETAQRILDKAHNDVIQINDEFDRVKQEFVKFRAKFRNFMKTQLETFDDLEKDLVKNYNISHPINDIVEKDIHIVPEDNTINTYKEEEVESKNMDEIKSFFANR